VKAARLTREMVVVTTVTVTDVNNPNEPDDDLDKDAVMTMSEGEQQPTSRSCINW